MRALGDMIDLSTELPRLLPSAIAWAQARSAEVAATGTPLLDSEVPLAKAVGVQRADLIRIKLVDALPLPEEQDLRLAAQQTGLLGPGMVGLTLGHGIYIVKGHRTNRLVSHECRHVYQFEMAGSIVSFLPAYLQQIVEYGYEMAPFEVDARMHERDGP